MAHVRETSLGTLLKAGLRIEPHEAVGLVVQLFHARQSALSRTALTPIDALRVTERGTIVRPSSLEWSESARLNEAALVLRAALPDRGAVNDSSVAETLRQLARAVLVPDRDPAFTSFERFRAALHPFAPLDSAEAVRAVFCRWWVLQGDAGDLTAPLSVFDDLMPDPPAGLRRRRLRPRLRAEPEESPIRPEIVSVVFSNAEAPLPWDGPDEIIDLETEGPTPWDAPSPPLASADRRGRAGHQAAGEARATRRRPCVDSGND